MSVGELDKEREKHYKWDQLYLSYMKNYYRKGCNDDSKESNASS